jgi:hypothetical protein
MHSLLWFLLMSRSYTVQYTAKSFQLSRANREMLQQAECDIQVNSISFFFSFSLNPQFLKENLVSYFICVGTHISICSINLTPDFVTLKL